MSTDEETEAIIARCLALNQVMAAHEAARDVAARERAELITVLSTTMTTRAIGARLGISAARVTQVRNMLKWGQRAGGSQVLNARYPS